MRPSPQTPGPEFEDAPDLLDVWSALRKRWRTVFGIPLAVTGLVVGASFLIPRTYTATTSFVPEAPSERGVTAGLAALAAPLGIELGANASVSPQFYADVAKSREILSRLLLARYPGPLAPAGAADSVTLLRILRLGGRTRQDSLERGGRKLGSVLGVGVNAQTGIVTVRATMQDPVLAAAVANRLVAYLNDFNTQTRQSLARERRKFTEQRVAAGESDLRETEDALKQFYQANRSWQQSPQLVFEEGRLRRQLELRQELYLTLRREYESARIEEVNTTPVITVIDTAVVPHRKSGPKRSLWAIVTLMLTGTFAVFWVFAAEYLERGTLRS